VLTAVAGGDKVNFVVVRVAWDRAHFDIYIYIYT
jgi:hypothetical protein